MNKIQEVIFDMDGLMFDTESLFSIVQKEIAKKRGKEFTLEIKGKMMGQKPLHAIKIMLNELGINEKPEDIFLEQNKKYVELLKTTSQSMPGLFELLNFLEDHKIKKGIATSSMSQWVSILLNKFAIQDRFEFILTGEDVKLGKPNPEIYLRAIKEFALSAFSCLVLEDAANGIKAASSAGCFAVAVPCVFTKNQDFSSANLIIDNLFDKRLFEILT